MEYVDGGDLATLLRRIGRLPEDRAIQAARQLCAGLLALLLGFTVSHILSGVRMTTELGAWHALPMQMAVGAIALVAGWGFWVSLAGRTLFRDEIRGAQLACG